MISRANLPLFRPRLPSAAAITPYLKAIDAARWYSNGGPLVVSLEERIADYLGVPSDGVASVANGTLGLDLALQAMGAKPGTLCMMPSWTFAATPAAAQRAGLVPWFVDVDRASWALSPSAALGLVRKAPGRIGAVMPVSVFGAPVDSIGWDRFMEATGIPVVIDMAAGFDTARPSRAPVMISLHATKAVGAGEGGIVASQDAGLVQDIRARANFGMKKGSRLADLAGTNAKLSEYAAAVAHASLDAWPQTRRAIETLSNAYVQAFANRRGIMLSPGFGAGWVGSTCNVALDVADSEGVIESLAADGIEAGRWWRRGCHVQRAFADCPRLPLPVTKDLGRRVIGLPFSVDMGADDVARVAAALRSTVARAGLAA
ncbi:MAG: DegT/DnrJ/EryC1/StrS family aminotransferase [Alphaproteobacteria bacterium]